MTHYRDIYVAIACRLYDDPIALLRLAMVCRAANSAVVVVFPITLAKWAVVEHRVNVNKRTQYLRLIPYVGITPELSSVEQQVSYVLKWGALYIQMTIYIAYTRVAIYNDGKSLQVFQVKQSTGAVTRIRLSRMEAAMSAARFVARVFPGVYEVVSCSLT